MSVGSVGGDGGSMAVSINMLAKVLESSQLQSQELMKSMVSVDLQNQVGEQKMAIAADIINAYGGDIDIEA